MLILVGPSASGKTQILQVLLKQYGLKKLVTYTTRTMRPKEVDGLDYHFITIDDFKKKIEDGFFFEYVNYNSNYYGTCKNDFGVEKAVILEPNGLHKYISEVKPLIKIVVLKCSSEILRIRMINRLDSKESVEKRLISDAIIFNNSLFKEADLIVDTSSSNIYDDAKKIFNFYKKSLEEGKNENIR